MSHHVTTSASRARIVLAPDEEALIPHLEAWTQLSEKAAEPNVFYEPALLLPALRHLADEGEVYVVLVYLEGGGGEDRLVGVFPVQRRRQRGLPVAKLSLWQHMHCFLTTPLVAHDAVAPALEAFVAHVASERVSLTEWGAVSADGPVFEALRACLERWGLPFHETRRFERALLVRSESAERFIAENVKRSRLRSLRRSRRKLEALGTVRGWRLGSDQDPTPWLDAFLALEAAGWKGRAGTALQQHPAQRRFFLESALALASAGKLALVGLLLDERPIAMQCSFRSAGASGGSFSFKVCYDESFARFGPGALIEPHNVEAFHDDPVAQWEDSCCAEPGEPVEDFWQGRRSIVSLQAAASKGVQSWLVRGVPLVRRGLQRLTAARPSGAA